jgi:hypothetical protein
VARRGLFFEDDEFAVRALASSRVGAGTPGWGPPDFDTISIPEAGGVVTLSSGTPTTG